MGRLSDTASASSTDAVGNMKKVSALGVTLVLFSLTGCIPPFSIFKPEKSASPEAAPTSVVTVYQTQAAPAPTVVVIVPDTQPQAPAAPAAPAPKSGTIASGTYSGVGTQSGGSSTRRTWVVDFSMSGSYGTVSYTRPDSRTATCAGTLTLISSGSGSSRWRERITSGGCDDNGVWELSQNDPSTMHGVWTYSGPYTVVGDFSRR